MMGFVYRKMKNTSEEQMTSEINTLIETYGRKVDYSDFDTLNHIIDDI